MTTAVLGRVRRIGRPGVIRLGVVGTALAIAAVALAIHLSMPSWYARLWYPMEHAGAINGEAAASGVPSDLIAAVIYRESKFSEDARSDQGAVGLMQVLPETALWIHRQPGGPAAPPERLAEPAVNIAYGTWYLHYLMDKYGSQELALAAYNGGESNLRRWLETARSGGQILQTEDIPFPETRGFVAGVQDAKEVYRRAWSDALAPRRK